MNSSSLPMEAQRTAVLTLDAAAESRVISASRTLPEFSAKSTAVPSAAVSRKISAILPFSSRTMASYASSAGWRI